jgi:hypothetical protein
MKKIFLAALCLPATLWSVQQDKVELYGALNQSNIIPHMEGPSQQRNNNEHVVTFYPAIPTAPSEFQVQNYTRQTDAPSRLLDKQNFVSTVSSHMQSSTEMVLWRTICSFMAWVQGELTCCGTYALKYGAENALDLGLRCAQRKLLSADLKVSFTVRLGCMFARWKIAEVIMQESYLAFLKPQACPTYLGWLIKDCGAWYTMYTAVYRQRPHSSDVVLKLCNII